MNHYNDQQPDNGSAIAGAVWIAIIVLLWLVAH